MKPRPSYLTLVFGAVLSLLIVGQANAQTNSATFVRSDTTTQGNWHGAYGADGFSVAGDTQSVPSYATFAVENQAEWTWDAESCDVRALQTGGGVGRIAATWYNSPSFSFALNFNDGNTHQFALYAIDWDGLGRAETIQVSDATTQAVLDTRSISAFSNGVYLVWSISGQVVVSVTGTGGPNGVVSGAFFGGSSSITSAASFVASDNNTQGNWHGTYGADGYSVANDSQSIPSYATFAIHNQSGFTYSSESTDVRALQTGSGVGRIAATWYNDPSFSFDVNFSDGNTHQFALYAIDWDSLGRAETIQVLDAATEAVLNTQNISGFTSGMYLVWSISGHVKINVICTSGPNAVVSGVFFGGSSTITSSTNFVRSDTTTQGNWHGMYGADGFSVAGDSQSVPSYATFAAQNEATWVYSSESTDVRALQTGSGVGRIAATWYNSTNVSFDVNFTDGNTHQFALYAIDWDNPGRAESIQVLDAATEAVLDTRSISAFTNGVYLVWKFSGHVTINVIVTAGPNAVVSGVFFGASTTITSSATFVTSDATTQGNWHGAYGADGYSVANDSQSLPAYAAFAIQNQAAWTWDDEATDVRALQTGSGVGRIAATWYNNPTFTFDVNLTDGQHHQVALYAVDWDSVGRAETIQVVDAGTEAVLDTENMSGFVSGIYLVWSISGHVRINVIGTAGPNAVISGVFFGGSSTITSTANFVKTDASTEGTWQGVYGADGYSLAGDAQSVPSYATFAIQNQSSWTWAANSSDPRALQTASGAGRIAATWYNSPSFSFDVNLTDGNSHQFALYAIDWDDSGRAESIQVLDAATEAVLNTQNISAFSNGVYLVWNLSGHVKINVIQTANTNAVISGVFWDPIPGSGGTPPVLQSISVTPTNPSTGVGAALQFTAIGTYSNGQTQNLSSSATWSSSSTQVATVNASGVATSQAVGSTTVSASVGAISGSTLLTVTASTPPTITAPASPSPNGAGWNNANVVVSYSCAAGAAPLSHSSCPMPQVITTEGANQQISGTVTDSAGITGSVFTTLNIDKTAPAITISSPADGTGFASPAVTISGSAVDSLSGLASVTCNGTSVTVTGGSFSCNISLNPGVNLVMVQATDIAGNVGASLLHLTLTAPLPAPTSLQITPANANVLVGATQQFTAVDQLGRPRSDATWNVDNTNIATISTDTSPILTGVAAGTATLTATIGSVSAQVQVNILGGTSLPVGTMVWSAPQVPGFTALQIVQAVPTANGPALFTIDQDINLNVLVRGFTSDGQQIWQSSLPYPQFPYVNQFTPAMGDALGGLLIVTGQGMLDLDGQSGAVAWQNANLTSGTASVGQDGSVLSVDSSGSFAKINPQSGQAVSAYTPPISFSSNETGTCTGPYPGSPVVSGVSAGAVPGNIGPSVVDAQGNAFFLVSASTNIRELGCVEGDPTLVTVTNTTQFWLVELMPNGTTTGTMLPISLPLPLFDQLTPPSILAPDGNGGAFVQWATTNSGAVIMDTSIGATYPSPLPNGLASQLVIGQNNNPLFTDGSAVGTILSGQAQLTYQSTGGNLTITAATGDGGLAINDSQQGAIQVDASGTPSIPVAALRGAVPFDMLSWQSIVNGVVTIIWSPNGSQGILNTLANSDSPTSGGDPQNQGRPPVCRTLHCAIAPHNDTSLPSDPFTGGAPSRTIQYEVFSLQDGVLQPLTFSQAAQIKLIVYEDMSNNPNTKICDYSTIAGGGCQSPNSVDSAGFYTDVYSAGNTGPNSVRQQFFLNRYETGVFWPEGGFNSQGFSIITWYGAASQTAAVDRVNIPFPVAAFITQLKPLFTGGASCPSGCSLRAPNGGNP